MNECDIFIAALEKGSSHERQAFLDVVCGDNAPLRHRIESLLQSHEEAGSILEHPIFWTAATVPPGQSEVSTDPIDGGAGPRPTLPEEIAFDFLTPSEDPAVLGRLDQYVVIGVVGRGGMGVVLKARDEKLNRVVAIKVMAPE